MTTDVHQEWKRFSEQVFDGLNVSKAQRDDMHHAFFMGMLTCLALLRESGAEANKQESAERVAQCLRDMTRQALHEMASEMPL